jgi:hypothetical protein
MAKKELTEVNLVIAKRIKGDTWKLVDGDDTIYSSLTNTLEAYFQKTQFKGDFRLSPANSVLHAITTEEKIIKPEPVKKFNIYGED